jgi:Zn-dependent peptidase ImmA (M78 family)/transcriptional regulator with XRE-family HTH domain
MLEVDALPLHDMPEVNSKILKWARETAGMTLEEAAKALGITRPERLEALEAGAEHPSRPLLLRMAKEYRRSLLTFYLANAPRRGDRGQDFRTLPADRSIEHDADLDALVRDLKGRQSLVRSILEEEDEATPLRFVGSRKISEAVAAVVRDIQKVLCIDLAVFRAKQNYDDAFAYVRERAEAAGIFVLLIGNLGTHHTAIPVEMFRGFAIADRVAPFVVINDQDSRAAWTSTLLHEIAHLFLGATGISGARAEEEIERFCNDVAGEFLLPVQELDALDVNDGTRPAVAIERITGFSKERHLSRAMVTYKLLRGQKIGRQTWQLLDRAFHQIWLAEREKHKAAAKKSEGGPNFYIVRRQRVGKALLKLVSRTMDAGNLTPVKAARVLGVKPRSVYPLLVDVSHVPEARGGI